MARGAAARRYAKALFELAKEDGRVAEVRAELAGMSAMVAESPELRDVLLQPLHPVAERKKVLHGVTERVGSSPILRSFYSFLIDQRRLFDFAAIREEYERMADEDAGLTKALVRSAVPLRDDQLDRLKQSLTRRTGRQVELDVEVDESLLGGVIAQVGDTLIDGSLRTQLHQLRLGLVKG